MSVTIELSDFPWLLTVGIPHGISSDGTRSRWRRDIRRWLKENEIEYLWEEMTSADVIFRVKTETDAVLVKMKWS